MIEEQAIRFYGSLKSTTQLPPSKPAHTEPMTGLYHSAQKTVQLFNEIITTKFISRTPSHRAFKSTIGGRRDRHLAARHGLVWDLHCQMFGLSVFINEKHRRWGMCATMQTSAFAEITGLVQVDGALVGKNTGIIIVKISSLTLRHIPLDTEPGAVSS